MKFANQIVQLFSLSYLGIRYTVYHIPYIFYCKRIQNWIRLFRALAREAFRESKYILYYIN